MERSEIKQIQQWMTNLADGDRAAFHPLFEALWPLSVSFSRRLLGNDADGDDAAQQALLKVFERASEFDSNRSALSWILAIVANECRSVRKKISRRKEENPEVLGAIAQEGLPLEEQAILQNLEAAIKEALTLLKPAEVQTILQAISEEMADRPQIQAATFRKRVQRALDRLRTVWRSKHGTL